MSRDQQVPRGTVPRVAAPRCRVLACPGVPLNNRLCVDHDTAEIRAMSRPHVYVFDGRRVVLESRPWEVDESEPQTARVPSAPTPVPALNSRPCWDWCGRSGPGPHCHPGSRFSPAPTFPCLACGRELHACQTTGLCCSGECTEFWRDLRLVAPAEAAARWLSPDELEAWQERAAIIAESMPPAMADHRALAMAWRARAAGRDRAAVAVVGLNAASEIPMPARPRPPSAAPGRALDGRNPAGATRDHAQLAFFGW